MTLPSKVPLTHARKKFSYVPSDRIYALHDAVVNCNLATDEGQKTLLAGVDPAFVSLLESKGDPSGRLLQNLFHLNSVEKLADGTVPLKLWLQNAWALAKVLPGATLFHETLTLLENRAERPPEPEAEAREQTVPVAKEPSDTSAPLASHELGKKLQELYILREKLEEQGESIASLQEQIHGIKQQLRSLPDLQAGDDLADGRFLLQELIGEGGFGKVWKAYDRARRMPVAIKVLRTQAGHDDASRRERFFRGAERMAGLRHPHIAQVFLKYGCEPYGNSHIVYYFVMELLSGGDFKQAVLNGSLPLEDRARIILETAQALEAAHAQGLIHRDVSPDNILLNEHRHAKLTDFDLVRAEDTTGGTQAGLGKNLFADPKALLDASQADESSDVYGLAMTLSFAVHGELLPASSLTNRMWFVRNLKCSEAVRNVILKAVNDDPAQRYSSMEEFRVALEKALRSQGIHPPSLTSRWARSGIGCLGYILFMCIGSLAYIRWMEGPEDFERGMRRIAYDVSNYFGPVLDGHAPGTPRLQLWPNGSTLKVSFLDGEPAMHQRVQEIASEWTRYANIKFEFTSRPDPNADIRVSFHYGLNYIGTEARKQPPGEPTLSLKFLNFYSDQNEEFAHEVLQAFGFALGLIKEWRNPNAGDIWDREEIYKHQKMVSGWLPKDVEERLIGPLPQTYPPYRALDVDSVMFDTPPRGYLRDGIKAQLNYRLSTSDKEFIGRLYPKPQ
jgi:hypothetical protein